MWIKQWTKGGDYEKSLRQRRMAALAMLAVGLVGFACYFLLVPSSGLSDHVQAFYLGAASGISFGALVLLVRTQYLLKNPQAQKRAKIQETDERKQRIATEAAQFAGVFTFFCSAAALFVVLPLSMEAYYALQTAMAVYCLSFLAANLWLSKKI